MTFLESRARIFALLCFGSFAGLFWDRYHILGVSDSASGLDGIVTIIVLIACGGIVIKGDIKRGLNSLAFIVSLLWVLIIISEKSLALCHRIDGISSHFVAFLLKLLSGGGACYYDSVLAVWQTTLGRTDGFQVISITVEKFGLYLVIGFLSSILCICSHLSTVYKKVFIAVISCICGYLAFVFAFAIRCVVAAECGNSLNIFSLPSFSISIVICSLITAFVLGSKLSAASYSTEVVAPSSIKSSLFNVVGIAGLFCVVLFLYWNPGLRNNRGQGMVLLDDAHSNWEWSEGSFGNDSFGERETYNARAFKHLISDFWKVKVDKAESITESMLADVRVLVIKMPTVPFSLSEINTIERFVGKGGGLLLIGDHTDLFGSSSFITPLANRFGISFQKTDQYDLLSGAPTSVSGSPFNVRSQFRSLKDLSFLTTCTLDAAIGADAISTCANGVEAVDYSHVNFFGDIKYELDELAGKFIQMSEVTFGKGRVIAFSDSTLLSTFCLFNDKKPELWIQVINRLYTEPSFLEVFRNRFAATFCMPIMIASLFLILIFGSWSCISTLSGAVASSVLILMLFNLKVDLGGLKRVVDTPYFIFDRNVSQSTLPTMIDFSQEVLESPQAFDMFFLNVFRCGIEPYEGKPSFISGPPAAEIIIQPSSAKDLKGQSISKYIKDAGKGSTVVIVADLGNPDQAKWIEDFFKYADIKARFRDVSVDGCMESKSKHTHRYIASDDRPDQVLNDDLAIDVFSCPLGEGKLVVLSGAKAFSRWGFGPIYSEACVSQKLGFTLQKNIIDKFILNRSEITIEAIRASAEEFADALKIEKEIIEKEKNDIRDN